MHDASLSDISKNETPSVAQDVFHRFLLSLVGNTQTVVFENLRGGLIVYIREIKYLKKKSQLNGGY